MGVVFGALAFIVLLAVAAFAVLAAIAAAVEILPLPANRDGDDRGGGPSVGAASAPRRRLANWHGPKARAEFNH